MDPAAAKILCERLHLERDLVLDFFCVFSRFEYALKRAGFAKKKRESVAANWVRFAQFLETRFAPGKNTELAEAFAYIRDNAPLTQTLGNNGLGWRDTERGGTEGELEWILRLIRTIRNNLFHGGRSPEWIASDPDKEIKLLKRSLIVLEACLDCHPQLKHYFEDGLRGYEPVPSDSSSV